MAQRQSRTGGESSLSGFLCMIVVGEMYARDSAIWMFPPNVLGRGKNKILRVME